MKRKYIYQQTTATGLYLYRSIDKHLKIRLLHISPPKLHIALGIKPDNEIIVDDKEVK